MTLRQFEDDNLHEMDDESIRSFLANQGMGVLGLPTDDVPYLLPMSYGFDGESTLYFTFVGGEGSRKQSLIERADRAGFLAYAAQTPFNWESVMVTGRVDSVPEAEWDALEPILETAWRPAVVEAAMETETLAVYELAVEEWTGLKHTGLPPGFDVDESR